MSQEAIRHNSNQVLRSKSGLHSVVKRKTAIVKCFTIETEGTTTKIVVNGKDFAEYFGRKYLENKVLEPIIRAQLEQSNLVFSCTVYGGGKAAQADAVRCAIARELCEKKPELRDLMRQYDLHKIDPRRKLRKMFGHRGHRAQMQYPIR